MLVKIVPALTTPDSISYEMSAQSSPAANGTTGKRACVVGGGPVGALSALYLAKDGWDVDVYELRGGKHCHPILHFFCHCS